MVTGRQREVIVIPFRTGVRVTGREFCGRTEELRLLREYVQSSGRVYVVGERRIGKTSLIFEALRTLRSTRLVYVDLLAVKTLEELTHRLGSALVRTEKRQSQLMALLKGLASLRPSVSADPVSNTPAVTFTAGSGGTLESLDQVFALLERWTALAVVFDEFQDVLAIPDHAAVVARLRSHIQLHENAAFVFCGSVRNDMERIFVAPDSPLFKSAMRVVVGPLDRPTFARFITRKFGTGERSIAPGVVGRILDVAGENPGDVQRFCTGIWQVTSPGGKVTEAEMARGLDMLFGLEREGYERVLLDLSAQQAQVLRALARAGGRANISKEFVAGSGITLVASVRKAATRLVEKRLVLKEGPEYRLCDPFLGTWLLRRNV